MTWALLAVTALLTGAFVAPAAGNHYQGNFPEFSYPYTQSNNQNCRNSAVDPINFAFKGPKGGISNAQDLLVQHVGWDNRAGGQQDLRVKSSNGSSYPCKDQGAQRASAGNFALSRYHTRLWLIPYSVNVGLKKTVGDAHYEELSCPGHATTTFDGARDRLINRMAAAGHGLEYEYWGNTRSFSQCGPNPSVGSGGAGYFIGAYHRH